MELSIRQSISQRDLQNKELSVIDQRFFVIGTQLPCTYKLASIPNTVSIIDTDLEHVQVPLNSKWDP